MFDLKKYLSEKRNTIESRLTALISYRHTAADIHSDTCHDTDAVDGCDILNDTIYNSGAERVVSAMMHSLMAGGKRLRPVLCLSAIEAVDEKHENRNPEKELDIACSLEMIHTYSLIHDDLPAMDNDDLRRGIPTCHRAFDEATAILAGDALLTFAFEVIADSLAGMPECTGIIRIIARAAGHNGMVAGQMFDIMSEGRNLSVDELKTLHRFKTGALIEASVISGAMIAGADKKKLDGLRKYARLIGLAFQVADDILNVEGDPELMGKAKGSDEELGKATFPSIIGLEESKKYAARLVDESVEALAEAGFDEKADPLRAIARYIIERKR